ncbi:MAG: hydroxymethylglutaryl-CoA lyase [Gammaproteobacteria bacterium]|nr:hydroxymethylglutaryl-CoA lyase [Gammaproteobacteria bacterium]
MDSVIINDVGPRDGLQNDPADVAPADRARLIRALVAAGIPAVEVASFVSPRAVPKMAGAADVVGALDLDTADFSALIPNQKGYELARAAGIRSVGVVLSATDTMNRKNINMDLDTTMRICAEIMEQARRDGLIGRAYVAVAVECPYEGRVPEERVESLSRRMFDSGAAEVIVADTIGAANPAQVKALFNRLIQAFGSERLSAHFHDTRALALANAWQALQCGIRKFDASIGGLGGCPFAPGAAGNLATEDLVSLLDQAGFHSGVDLDALLEVVEQVQQMTGHQLGGRTLPWLRSSRAPAVASAP